MCLLVGNAAEEWRGPNSFQAGRSDTAEKASTRNFSGMSYNHVLEGAGAQMYVPAFKFASWRPRDGKGATVSTDGRRRRPHDEDWRMNREGSSTVEVVSAGRLANAKSAFQKAN